MYGHAAYASAAMFEPTSCHPPSTAPTPTSYQSLAATNAHAQSSSVPNPAYQGQPAGYSSSHSGYQQSSYSQQPSGSAQGSYSQQPGYSSQQQGGYYAAPDGPACTAVTEEGEEEEEEIKPPPGYLTLEDTAVSGSHAP
jgi:hypothetical protein